MIEIRPLVEQRREQVHLERIEHAGEGAGDGESVDRHCAEPQAEKQRRYHVANDQCAQDRQQGRQDRHPSRNDSCRRLGNDSSVLDEFEVGWARRCDGDAGREVAPVVEPLGVERAAADPHLQQGRRIDGRRVNRDIERYVGEYHRWRGDLILLCPRRCAQGDGDGDHEEAPRTGGARSGSASAIASVANRPGGHETLSRTGTCS